MRAMILTGLIAAVAATPAQALCSYNGKLYATTTLAQEFRDAKWVVRAKLEAADNHWANNGESWTVYTVRVLRRYKGPPANMLRVFTFRDSGGFYLDKGAVPDLDNDYLLFLNPPVQTPPRGVRNVTEVNYSCGQSKPIGEVSPVDLRLLDRLSAGRWR